jgi:hypothetical protein
MRILISLLLATTTIYAAFAQEGTRTIGGAGAFTAGTALIDGRLYPLLGGRGGVLLDRCFLIGGGGASGWGTTQGVAGGNATLDFGYGGLLFGWWPMPDARVRPTFEILVGGGGYEREELVEGDLYRITRSGGFALAGDAGVSIRTHEHIRLSITGGWRTVMSGDPLMNGASVQAGIWFGEF